MQRGLIIALGVAFLCTPLHAQTQEQISLGVGLAIPSMRFQSQLNGNYGMDGISRAFFATPHYSEFLGTFLKGNVYDISTPYREKVKSKVCWFGSVIVRIKPQIPLTISASYEHLGYTGSADALFYPYAGGTDKWTTHLSSDLKIIGLAFTVGMETKGRSRIGFHVGPAVQFQMLSQVTQDMGIFQTSYNRPQLNVELGFEGNITFVQPLNNRDDLTLTFGLQGAALDFSNPGDRSLNFTRQIHLSYRHTLSKILSKFRR